MELDLEEYRPASPPVRRKLARGAARSLLVTPWFAASAGVVIAAALWINSPYTVLRFNGGTPAINTCVGTGCRIAGGGQPDLSSPGQKFRNHRHAGRNAGADRAARRRVKGVTFTYMAWQHGDKFGEVITLSGRRLPAHWKLQFEILGTRITRVAGAHWQQWASDDGGTASPLRLSRSGPEWHSDVAMFFVFGSGQATGPVNCLFDGAFCTFSQAKGGDQGLGGGQHGQGGQGDGGWPGSGR
jgi:hypothetical protein